MEDPLLYLRTLYRSFRYLASEMALTAYAQTTKFTPRLTQPPEFEDQLLLPAT